MTPSLLAAWMSLYERFGTMPLQHPPSLLARGGDAEGFHVLAVPADAPAFATALERRSAAVWTCLVPAQPLLLEPGTADVPSLRSHLEAFVARTGARVVYFPLVYRTSASASLLLALPGMRCWGRAPSPAIDWSRRGGDLWPRVRARWGSQADRKRRQCERRLRVVELEGEAAVEAVDTIERRSWKSPAGLGLRSRPGQFEYYATLVRDGVARASVAMDGDRPAAYRLDARQGDTVYIIKWSFDDEYRRLSPGFHMLTTALVDRWAGEPIAEVDLLGHPDTLKCLLETHRNPRLDVAWPDGPEASNLRARFTAYDDRRLRHLESGRSLRTFF